MKTRRYLLPVVVGAAVAAALSCREPSPLGTGSAALLAPDSVVDSATVNPHQVPVDSIVHAGGLLTCSPLPYDSATQVIGPLGGTIQVGMDTLVVPAGALLAPVAITMVAPSDTVNLWALLTITSRVSDSLRITFTAFACQQTLPDSIASGRRHSRDVSSLVIPAKSHYADSTS